MQAYSTKVPFSIVKNFDMAQVAVAVESLDNTFIVRAALSSFDTVSLRIILVGTRGI